MAKPAITSRDSMRQVRLHVAKLGSSYTSADPKSCWPLSTEFKNSESDVGGQDRHTSSPSISLSRARNIYLEDITDVQRQLSLPVNRPFKIIVLTPLSRPWNSNVPMKNRVCRIDASFHGRSRTPGVLRIPLNIFTDLVWFNYVFFIDWWANIISFSFIYWYIYD